MGCLLSDDLFYSNSYLTFSLPISNKYRLLILALGFEAAKLIKLETTLMIDCPSNVFACSVNR